MSNFATLGSDIVYVVLLFIVYLNILSAASQLLMKNSNYYGSNETKAKRKHSHSPYYVKKGSASCETKWILVEVW